MRGGRWRTETSTEGDGDSTTFSVSSTSNGCERPEDRPMTDRELRRKLDDIESAAKRARIERPGLYIMVVLIFLRGCSLETDIGNVKTKLTGLEANVGSKIVVTK